MTTKSNLSSTALKALTTMALTLPGIHHARCETVMSKPQSDFGMTHVNEGKNHYKIDVYMAQLGIPLTPKMDLTITANQDVMTGASSFGYEPGGFRHPELQPSTLVAGRSSNSIHDHRSAGDVNVRYFGDEYHVGVGATLSEENFYESQTVHLKLTNEWNKSNTELSWGYSFSNDSIKPTIDNSQDPGFPLARVKTRQGKLTQRFTLDLRQDLTKTSLAQAGVEFTANRGYLDDPYKGSFVWGNPNREGADGGGQVYLPAAPFGPFDPAVFPEGLSGIRDSRPDYKGALAANIKLIQYLTPLHAALHIDYRFASSTWDVKSHTLSIDYFQELGDSWQVIPSFRYYTQSEAYFYAMAFDAVGTAPFPSKRIGSTGPASSDYRLGKFGSLTSELKVRYRFMADKSGKLTFVFGHINRRNMFYLGSKPYPINTDNDFKTYYGSLGLSFVF